MLVPPRGIASGGAMDILFGISVAEVQFRTDAENQNQFHSGSPVLAVVRFSVLRILQNSSTV